MAVKFLSEEWAEALKEALNDDEAFRGRRRPRADPAGHHRRDGETQYWIVIADGQIDIGLGDLDSPDATITQSYETAAALAKGELSPSRPS